jgi:predicted RNase H-like HicB family nuclease
MNDRTTSARAFRAGQASFDCGAGNESGTGAILEDKRYRVALVQSDEGVAASCPALRGCHSQGATKEAAIRYITEAIRDLLAAEEDERAGLTVTETEVVV